MFLLINILLYLAAEGAEVTQVIAKEQGNSYWFEVTVKSPDEGCKQYADWWEIIDETDKLLYRRILTHSHVNEQPFTRSGGPLKISPDKIIIIRAHMNNLGYGTRAMKGSINNGFKAIKLANGFANSLAFEEPLPNGCRF